MEKSGAGCSGWRGCRKWGVSLAGRRRPAPLLPEDRLPVRARGAGRSAQGHRCMSSAAHQLPAGSRGRTAALRKVRPEALARGAGAWGMAVWSGAGSPCAASGPVHAGTGRVGSIRRNIIALILARQLATLASCSPRRLVSPIEQEPGSVLTFVIVDRCA